MFVANSLSGMVQTPSFNGLKHVFHPNFTLHLFTQIRSSFAFPSSLWILRSSQWTNHMLLFWCQFFFIKTLFTGRFIILSNQVIYDFYFKKFFWLRCPSKNLFHHHFGIFHLISFLLFHHLCFQYYFNSFHHPHFSNAISKCMPLPYQKKMPRYFLLSPEQSSCSDTIIIMCPWLINALDLYGIFLLPP